MSILDHAIMRETIDDGAAGPLTVALVCDDMDHDPRADMTNGCRLVDWNRNYRIATGTDCDDQQIPRDHVDYYGSFAELIRDNVDPGAGKIHAVRGYNVRDYGNGARITLADGDWRDWRDWDGFAVVTDADFGRVGRNESMPAREQAAALIDGDLAVVDHVLAGEVYGWVVVDDYGDILESCWGYYGETDYPMTEARDAARAIHAERSQRDADAAQRRADIIRTARHAGILVERVA